MIFLFEKDDPFRGGVDDCRRVADEQSPSGEQWRNEQGGRATCMGMFRELGMGGAAWQRIASCHPPGAQSGPPCYQYDNQENNKYEKVYGMLRAAEILCIISLLLHCCSPYYIGSILFSQMAPNDIIITSITHSTLH